MGSCSNCSTLTNKEEKTIEILRSGPLNYIQIDNQIQQSEDQITSRKKYSPIIDIKKGFEEYLVKIYSDQKQEIENQPKIQSILHFLFLIEYGKDQEYITKRIYDYMCGKFLNKLLKAQYIQFGDQEYDNNLEQLQYLFKGKFQTYYDFPMVSIQTDCKIDFNIDDMGVLDEFNQKQLIEYSIKLMGIIILQTNIDIIFQENYCSIIVKQFRFIEILRKNLMKILMKYIQIIQQ